MLVINMPAQKSLFINGNEHNYSDGRHTRSVWSVSWSR